MSDRRKLTSTVTSMSIHIEGDNPVIGERNTNIELEDEGAGTFFIISSNQEREEGIALELDELELLLEKAKWMMNQVGCNEVKK